MEAVTKTVRNNRENRIADGCRWGTLKTTEGHTIHVVCPPVVFIKPHVF